MFRVLFKFPRIYFTLKLFGRTFSLDIGWFWSDIMSDWAFGPRFTAEKITCGDGDWTSYYCALGFFAFEHEFLISVGMSDVD
jgi:hypothetical protein